MRLGRQGFTLVELLAVIGIIAVLIGLALPGLSGANRRAKETVVLSNLRQSAIVFEQYTQQYHGSLPWAPAGTGFSLTPDMPPTSTLWGGYWDLSRYWSSLMQGVAPWPEWFGMWCIPDPHRPTDAPWHPDASQGSGFSDGVSSFEYARSLFARPLIWQPGPGILDEAEVHRPVRVHEVRYPSSKGLLFDSEACARVHCANNGMSIDRAVLFVDGHAAYHALEDAALPLAGRDPSIAGFGPLPIHDTEDGAYGRDY